MILTWVKLRFFSLNIISIVRAELVGASAALLKPPDRRAEWDEVDIRVAVDWASSKLQVNRNVKARHASIVQPVAAREGGSCRREGG